MRGGNGDRSPSHPFVSAPAFSSLMALLRLRHHSSPFPPLPLAVVVAAAAVTQRLYACLHTLRYASLTVYIASSPCERRTCVLAPAPPRHDAHFPVLIHPFLRVSSIPRLRGPCDSVSRLSPSSQVCEMRTGGLLRLAFCLCRANEEGLARTT